MLKQNRTLLIVVAIALLIIPAVMAASFTNSTPAEIDDGTQARSVTVSGIGTVQTISVIVNFEKIDDDSEPACSALGGAGHDGGSPYNDEISFALTSPGGTTVNLVYAGEGGPPELPEVPEFPGGPESISAPQAFGDATYTSTDIYGGVVTVVFDDSAPSVVGGTHPISGVFRPEEPLSAFLGQNADGVWTLVAGDNTGGDPLCLNYWTLVLNDELCLAPQFPVQGSALVNGSVFGYDEAGGNIIYDSQGAPLQVFNDADGGGQDEYLIVATDTVDDEEWYGLFLGGCNPVWVKAEWVTRIR